MKTSETNTTHISYKLKFIIDQIVPDFTTLTINTNNFTQNWTSDWKKRTETQAPFIQNIQSTDGQNWRNKVSLTIFIPKISFIF